MNDNGKLTSCIGLIIAFVVGIVLITLWGGYVLSTVWGLLLVPVFGLPPITVAQAIGLSSIVSFLTIPLDTKSNVAKSKGMDDAFIDFLAILGASFARGLFVLIIVNLVV